MRRAPAARFLLALILTVPLSAQDRITGLPFASRSEVLARNGMAATSQPLASQVAVEILREGGNAVDAAIAANAALALMEPTGCGLGGDLFALVWDPESGRLHGLNASGRSPRGTSLEELQERLAAEGLDRIPPHGVLPISVPGCVDGWFELHERFGRLPMERVLAPAVRYAREGFPVSELIAFYWERSVSVLRHQPGFLETFTVDGRAPRKGEIWTHPALATTLERLGKEGRDLFYRGEFAERMAAFLAEHDGLLTYEDFATHRSEWVEPVSVTYRGVEVWELPPNGQGITALEMLNILEGYDLRAMGFGSADYAHVFTEAKKLAFEDRARWIADPAFYDPPLERLLSKEYAAGLRRRIRMDRALQAVAEAPPAFEEGDTIYLCTADREGQMVSLIQSNFRGMGSGVCPPGLGFGFQNRGELFDLEEGRPNTYAPGKRPFHTIIPAFLTRGGRPWVAFGVMGGATQPQGHVQIVVNLVDFGMNLQEAGDAPRLVHVGSSQPTGEHMDDGGRLGLESGWSDEVRAELRRRGHRFTENGFFGGYQAIARDPDNGVWIGASESRKDGQAAGW